MVVEVPNDALEALEASGDGGLAASDAGAGAVDDGVLVGAQGNASAGVGEALGAGDEGQGVAPDDGELVGCGEEEREAAQIDPGGGCVDEGPGLGIAIEGHEVAYAEAGLAQRNF